MAIAKKNYGQVKLTSSYTAYTDTTGNQWTGTAGTVNSATFAADFATLGIPTGSTINSAKFTYTESTYPLHGFGTKALRSGGTNISTWFDSGTTVTLSSVATFYVRFVSGKTNTSYPSVSPYGINTKTNSGTWTLDNLTLTVDYTPPYTKCTAPTTVTGGTATAIPNTNYTISWSG